MDGSSCCDLMKQVKQIPVSGCGGLGRNPRRKFFRILLDMDGTIIDSRGQNVKATNAALSHFGLKTISDYRFRQIFSQANDFMDMHLEVLMILDLFFLVNELSINSDSS